MAKKRAKEAIKNGEVPKLQEWSVPSLPRFSAEKGPLDFIEKL